MQPVNLFNLASQQANWITARQEAIASNIANVNTPDYKALGVASFKDVLGKRAGGLDVTNTRHIQPGRGDGTSAIAINQRDGANGAGTGVRLEHELIDASGVRRDYEMNTAIVKSFHRMILSTVRR